MPAVKNKRYEVTRDSKTGNIIMVEVEIPTSAEASEEETVQSEFRGTSTTSLDCSTTESRILTDNFIEEYRKHECLWNLNIDESKDKKLRGEAIQSLCSTFSMLERDVKTKIASLRTYYSKELAKYRAAALKNESYVSKWPHSAQLEFLNDFIVPRGQMRVRHRGRTSSSSYKSYKPASEIIDLQDAIRSISGGGHASYDAATPRKRPKFETLAGSGVEHEYASAEEPLKLVKTQSDTDNKLDKLLDVASDLLQCTQNSLAEDDAEGVFGKHVAKELRDIEDPQQKKLAKLRIQNVLYEIQYGSPVE